MNFGRAIRLMIISVIAVATTLKSVSCKSSQPNNSDNSIERRLLENEYSDDENLSEEYEDSLVEKEENFSKEYENNSVEITEITPYSVLDATILLHILRDKA